MEENKEKACLVCQQNENQVPLVELSYKNQKYHICPQHIPVLIHNPGQLEGLLPGAGDLQAG
ncbi:MAG: hypothetical protein GXO88_01580 [Chlorobi bacterium]|nr:hypothetical protein [Chlorobiota bacterium]